MRHLRTLQRCRNGENYQTLTGGVVSIVLVIIFAGMFFSLTMNTFNNSIIFSQMSVSYDDNPTPAQLTTAPAHTFMFAVGLTGIDFRNTQRYFDVSLSQRINTKTTSGSSKVKQVIALEPCTFDHWQGVSDSITTSYSVLNLST